MFVNILIYTLLTWSLVGLALSIIFLVRNEAVYTYRVELLRDIGAATKRDILNATNIEDWMWRYDMFDSVSYNTMVWKFWKPLDSFYKDKSFLR